MEQRLSEGRSISSFGLHLLAMILMLCDHLWATVVPGSLWLTCLGRLAFPLFAFLIAEGYHQTRDSKKYLLRLLVIALIAEIPFNLMTFASPIFPFHQNTIWTLLLSLLCLRGLDRLKEKKLPLAIVLSLLLCLVILLVAQIGMADYGTAGVLTVLLFHFCRGRSLPRRLLQLAGLLVINFLLIKGQVLPLGDAAFPVQGFAVLAMVPICLYRGRQGPHGRGVRALCYGFYPVHMLILGLLSL